MAEKFRNFDGEILKFLIHEKFMLKSLRAQFFTDFNHCYTKMNRRALSIKKKK